MHVKEVYAEASEYMPALSHPRSSFCLLHTEAGKSQAILDCRKAFQFSWQP